MVLGEQKPCGAGRGAEILAGLSVVLAADRLKITLFLIAVCAIDYWATAELMHKNALETP